MARFKISQASTVYVLAMTVVGLVGMLLIWADFVIRV